jgi:hypothetical protein
MQGGKVILNRNRLIQPNQTKLKFNKTKRNNIRNNIRNKSVKKMIKKNDTIVYHYTPPPMTKEELSVIQKMMSMSSEKPKNLYEMSDQTKGLMDVIMTVAKKIPNKI